MRLRPRRPARRPCTALRLPHLERLLARLTPRATDWSPAPRAEPAARARAGRLPRLAAARWTSAAGRMAAQGDGLEPAASEQGWGLLTPTHWQVGSEQILLLDPAQLHLDEDESRALAGCAAQSVRARGLDAALGRAAALVRHARVLARTGHRLAGPRGRPGHRPVAARPAGRPQRCAACRARRRCCCTPTRSTRRAKRAANWR